MIRCCVSGLELCLPLHVCPEDDASHLRNRGCAAATSLEDKSLIDLRSASDGTAISGQ